ncbi:UNVERIFIED_CONTAM: hypothetical protein FKN15_038747 [Acipenser sinensis]
MERWHEHQRELKEGGATWCLACLEYGHLPDVCPYEDPLFVQAFDRGEVETAEEWIHLKAIPSPQVDQETCLTCVKGEEWYFAIGKVGHKAPNQPPPWQEVELLVPKKGRRGGAKKEEEEKEKHWFPATEGDYTLSPPPQLPPAGAEQQELPLSPPLPPAGVEQRELPLPPPPPPPGAEQRELPLPPPPPPPGAEQRELPLPSPPPPAEGEMSAGSTSSTVGGQLTAYTSTSKG